MINIFIRRKKGCTDSCSLICALFYLLSSQSLPQTPSAECCAEAFRAKALTLHRCDAMRAEDVCFAGGGGRRNEHVCCCV